MRAAGADDSKTHNATSDRDEAVVAAPGEVIPGTTGGAIRVAAPGVELARLRRLLREHADAVALVTITVIAAAVRFATIDVQSFDHDESVTAYTVLHPSLAATLSVVSHLERSPPLYYVLAWLWAKPFSTGQVDLRLLSAIFGTLTVPVAFLAGRELASRRAGLIAAAFVALNPFLVWYSQEARAYALLVLLSTLGLFLFARARRAPTRRNLALWALTSVLALSSHYFAVFMIAPEGIWLIATTRPRSRALGAVAATALAGLALLPLAIVQESGRRLSPFAAIGILTRAWQILVHFASSLEPNILARGFVGILQVAVGVGEVALAIAAVTIAWRFGARAERRAALVALSIGAAAFLVPVLMAIGEVDYVDARNMIASLVPLLVAAAIAFGSKRARGYGLAAAAATCVLFAGVLVAVNVTPKMQRIDWRGAAQAIGPAPVKRVVVVPRLGQVPIAYYLHGAAFKFKSRPVFVRRLDVLSREGVATPPGAGFRLVAAPRRVPGGLWLWHYEARRPELVHPWLVDGIRLIPTGATAFLTGDPDRPAPRFTKPSRATL